MAQNSAQNNNNAQMPAVQLNQLPANGQNQVNPFPKFPSQNISF